MLPPFLASLIYSTETALGQVAVRVCRITIPGSGMIFSFGGSHCSTMASEADTHTLIIISQLHNRMCVWKSLSKVMLKDKLNIN